MNKRERKLLILIGGLVGVFVIGFGVRLIVLQPARNLDSQIAGLRRQIAKLRDERRTYFADEEKIKAITRITFAEQVDRASAKSGEMLTKAILHSGLRESDFTRLPVGPRKIRGADEIGWNVQGDGQLMSVINLLFQLQESPYLHRIEGLAIVDANAPGYVKVRFKFLTLIIDPAPDVKLAPLVTQYALNSEPRRHYDGIVQRDILRPYIQRPPPPPAPPQSTPPPPPVQPGPESMRIVSLSEWEGVPEVHVRDLVNQRTIQYKVGDDLAGGTIVMVDYRPMPMSGHAGLQSFSRVILKIGTEYWAIERGRTLMEKHKLSPAQLPENLSKL